MKKCIGISGIDNSGKSVVARGIHHCLRKKYKMKVELVGSKNLPSAIPQLQALYFLENEAFDLRKIEDRRKLRSFFINRSMAHNLAEMELILEYGLEEYTKKFPGSLVIRDRTLFRDGVAYACANYVSSGHNIQEAFKKVRDRLSQLKVDLSCYPYPIVYLDLAPQVENLNEKSRLSIDIYRKRESEVRKHDIYGQRTEIFLDKVIKAYKFLDENIKGEVMSINATSPIEKVISEAIECIKSLGLI
jgi:thymidylate kinase